MAVNCFYKVSDVKSCGKKDIDIQSHVGFSDNQVQVTVTFYGEKQREDIILYADLSSQSAFLSPLRFGI